MTTRERNLTVAVAAAGALLLGSRGLENYRAAVDRSDNLQREATLALDDANFAMLRGQRARGKLQHWRRRSLPTQRAVAESLYQDWLRARLTAAGLTVKELSDKSTPNRGPQFGELSVTASVEGTLAQLSDFLYGFYTAPHLHRISGATLTPPKEGDKLVASLIIDALILPECDRTDRLSQGPAQELPQKAEDIRKSLVSRNMFAAYAPKPDANAAGADGEAADAKLSALTLGDRGWWFDVRQQKSGTVSHYFPGDAIKIGRFEGKVVDVDNRRAVIETAAGRVEVRLGQTFDKATPVEAEAT